MNTERILRDAVKAHLHDVLGNSYFDICGIRRIDNIAQKKLFTKEQYFIMESLHCVKWTAMNPEDARQIRNMVTTAVASYLPIAEPVVIDVPATTVSESAWSTVTKTFSRALHRANTA